MQLTRADGVAKRYYSMSSQIRMDRAAYYLELERCQQASLDITPWLVWFLNCLKNALEASYLVTGKVIFKHHFWNEHTSRLANDRQHIMLNRLLDGFKSNLNSSKWAKICKCSSDTALRDIQDLVEKGILENAPGGGRSTHYRLVNYSFS